MEPLSLKTRRFYSALFFVLFLIILPIVTLYASGYRIKGLGLVSTGGIYIAVPVSGFTLSLNGEELERSNLFSKSFFFDNLAPGSYVVQAVAEGYYPWSKTLFVESQLVSDVSVLAITQPLSVREVVTKSPQEEVGTSTVVVVTRERYDTIESIFLVTTTPVISSELASEPPADVRGGVALVVEEGNLFMRFERDSQPPSSFCIRPSSCAQVFALEKGSETVTDAQFFAGGVLYRTRESGVYFTEADVRAPRLTIPIFTTPNARFEVIDGVLTVADETSYYEVTGF
ncbi:MAG: hypothetical protein AAB439_01375 [Patescibacteria group bacterium]